MTTPNGPIRALVFACSLLALASCSGGSGPAAGSTGTTLRIGAVLPLSGPAGPGGRDEQRGLQVAADLVNQAGGVGGRQITVTSVDAPSAAAAAPSVDGLHRKGAALVVGGFSSDLSLPASAEAAKDGLIYWEAGAEADRITGRGLPTVFRVGATGGQLGSNSGHFIATQLAPLLHTAPAHLRVAVVQADDAYATAVADGVAGVLRTAGASVVTRQRYDAYAPQWAPILAAVKAAHPQVLVLASHIPDGIAFRRAFLAAHLYVQAFVGSTMAQCLPDFGDALGPEAVGVFASDRPDADFAPSTLSGEGQATYDEFAAAWQKKYGGTPDMEALSGFTAGWVLFHDVLPKAAAAGALTTDGIAAAARSTVLPPGALPNGAGLHFATDAARMGQNLDAAAVIWQWQAPRHSVVVWPAQWATGSIEMVPAPVTGERA